MKVNVELDALLAMIAELASDAKDEARIKFTGTRADAVTMGIAFLHEHLRISFQDAEDFDLATKSEAEILQGAIGDFCRKQCSHSKATEPGAADACPGCVLMPFTTGAVERVVARAMGADMKPTGPRHGFDPDVVATARAKLDAETEK